MATNNKNSFPLTPEQTHAVDLFLTGDSLAVEALAGAGKTSTLRAMANAAPDRTAVYAAFNRKIVNDAKRSMPDNVAVSTVHSLAYRAVGWRYRGRLDAPFQSGKQKAKLLGLNLDHPVVVDLDEETKEISQATIATAAYETVTRFCQTADEHLMLRHVFHLPGIDLPGEWTNHDRLAPRILSLAEQIWADLQRERGRFQFSHAHYLKLWELNRPVIGADAILFDEAQDASPVMQSIIEQQAGRSQIVYVGDSRQAIYEWMGAVDALALADVKHRAMLTKSFRFGPEIAEAANIVLARVDPDGPRVEGAGKPGQLTKLNRPDCVLGRTNAGVVAEAFRLIDAGYRVAIQGGTKEITAFAKGAAALQDGRRTEHPQLACFTGWDEVIDYSEREEGAELRVLVNLVEDFGAEDLVAQLRCTVDDRRADVVCSTAHKSKGAEWHGVQILGDFPNGDGPRPVTPEELRLLYVAVTRAKTKLDVDRGLLTGPPKDKGPALNLL